MELGRVRGNAGAELLLWMSPKEMGKEAETQVIVWECRAYVPESAWAVAGKGEVFEQIDPNSLEL